MKRMEKWPNFVVSGLCKKSTIVTGIVIIIMSDLKSQKIYANVT